MLDTPSISVLIPAKNAAKTIHIAIEDALLQEGVDCHIYIANDNSTDGTMTVIESYMEQTDQITVLNVPAPGGIVAGRNMLLQRVKTPFLAWLDADDGWSRKDKLQKQIAFLTKNPEMALVGDAKINCLYMPYFKQKIVRFPLFNKDIQIRLLFKNSFIMSSIVARTAMVCKFTFNPNMEYLEDYAWVKNIALQHPVRNLALGGTLHLIHAEDTQHQKNAQYQVYEKESKILQDSFAKEGLVLGEKESKNLSFFVRRNKKLNADEAIALRKSIKNTSQSLIAAGHQKTDVNAFFSNIKLRIIKCRWFLR